MSENVFFERQSGSNCRVHAINNCFGGNHVTPEEFSKFYKLYREQLGEKSDFEFDFVHADTSRESLLSFILWHKFRLTTFTVGQYELKRLREARVVRSLLDIVDWELKRFFVCNDSHVFCVRYVNDTWVQIDNGVQTTTLARWENDPSLTFVFPWTMVRCKQGVNEMQKLVQKQFPDATLESLSAEIIADLSQREPTHFGDCQNWIALFFKYVGISYPDEHKAVLRYRKFASKSPLDVVNALEHLPVLILHIIHFSVV